jgi:hypothetical protein
MATLAFFWIAFPLGHLIPSFHFQSVGVLSGEVKPLSVLVH